MGCKVLQPVYFKLGKRSKNFIIIFIKGEINGGRINFLKTSLLAKEGLREVK